MAYRNTKRNSKNISKSNMNEDDVKRQVEDQVEKNEMNEMNENIEDNIEIQEDIESSTTQKYDTFEKWDDENVNIKRKLLRGIYSYGFEIPSSIQKKSIMSVIQGRDIIAQAQSGTGKTGAFTISSLQKVDETLNAPQILILAPTHELSTQIYRVCSSIGQYMKLKYHLLIGGTPVEQDKEVLMDEEKTPHIIVGCPGRVHDMLRRGWLSPDDLKMIVLDEADEMLSHCFKEQVHKIFKYLPPRIQVALFSATIPEEVHALTKKFMSKPVKILVKSEMLTLDGLLQYYISLDDDLQKYATLKDIFKSVSMSQTILYCNSVKRVKDLREAMEQDGFPVICIHSSMVDGERKEAIQEFKQGKYRVLISSDVTARGIDIQQVGVVINFDIPKSVHTYLHRIGRSARWGRKGVAINFVTKRDTYKIKEIEQWYNTQIEELPDDYASKMRCV